MGYCPVNRGDGLTRDCSRHKNGDRPQMIHKDMGVYFISLPAKVVPCPVYPARSGPFGVGRKKIILAGAAVFSFAKPCRIRAQDSQAGEK